MNGKPAGDSPGYTRSDKRALLTASCIATLISPLMGTMINLALKTIGEEFAVGAHTLALLTTVFFVSSVVFLAPAARLSEIYGKRKVFMTGLALTALSAMLGSMSPDFWTLCFFRIMMGASTAMTLCTSLSMISDVFPRGERGFAIAVNTAFVYIGASIGPVLGGLLTDMLGWRSTFYVIVPVALVAILSLSAFRHEVTSSPGEPFDLKGAVVYGVSISLVMFGVFNVLEPYAFPLIAFGGLMLYYFLKSQRDAEYPVLRVSMFRTRGFRMSSAAIFLNYMSVHSTSFLLSLYLQSMGALTPMEAGGLMFIQPVVQTVLTPIVGKLTDRTQPRYLMVAGMFATLLGLVTLFHVTETLNVALVVSAMVALGFGFSLFSAPSTTSMMSYCDRKEYSAASATVAIVRQSAMMVALSIAMAVIAVVMGSADNLVPENYASFLLSMRIVWGIGIVLSLIGITVSWRIGE
ncbi:MAG: MFS transporter [Thermoplasmatales archaeon]|nr:MFS transporter [Thermoplasmatales archaeon]